MQYIDGWGAVVVMMVRVVCMLGGGRGGGSHSPSDPTLLIHLPHLRGQNLEDSTMESRPGCHALTLYRPTNF